LETLGCKLNQAEAESLARELGAAGLHLVASDEPCDVFVINSCAVTATAEAKARHLLRLAYHRNPQAILAVLGCYSESVAGLLHSLAGAQGLLCRDKTELVPRLQALGYGGANLQYNPGRRTRAFVKAQEGCRNFCAYCIVPLLRGREKSRPHDEIVSEIDDRVREGYREVVLTGTEIGAYRYRRLGLEGLLRRILEKTEVARLRLSSLQPPEVTSTLLGLWQDERLCPHFHLSLQSGSDGVLRRMGRRYDVAGYLAAVAGIREALPEVAITTDIIVGFPGETAAEFEESYQLCASLGFARIHVFPFSPRPGTTAAAMPDQVAENIKKERSQSMLALAGESARTFRTRFLGRTLTVLWEAEAEGILSGYTGNYIRVYTEAEAGLVNTITAATLVKLYRDGVWGAKEAL